MARQPQSPTGNSLDDKFRIAWQRHHPQNGMEIATSNSNLTSDNNSLTDNLIEPYSTLQDKAAERNSTKTTQSNSTSRRNSVSFAAGTRGVGENGE